MNFVYLKGGWRGKNIDWDPRAPVPPDPYTERVKELEHVRMRGKAKSKKKAEKKNKNKKRT